MGAHLGKRSTGNSPTGEASRVIPNPATYTFQGSTSGYTSGGSGGNTPSFDAQNVIDKFSFSSDGNATDVGDLTAARHEVAGSSSGFHGYTAGGETMPGAPYVRHDTIDRFPFSSDGNATDVGDLTSGRSGSNGGQSSAENGYTSGGYPNPDHMDKIEKYSFVVGASGTTVGDLTVGRSNAAGQSSTTHGYVSGGWSPYSTVIDKFPFSSDTNATDVGDLTQARTILAGQSSTTHGYSSGGQSPSIVNTIDKFPFSSDANATDVGDLYAGRNRLAGQSSTTHGYSSGGAGAQDDIIDKFPFSSDNNASDVGDLTVDRGYVAGQQV